MADIWIKPTGNDTTGTGTESNPYATPAKLASVATATDNCIIGEGTYYLPSGTLVFECLTMTGEYKHPMVARPSFKRLASNCNLRFNNQFINIENMEFVNLGTSTGTTGAGVFFVSNAGQNTVKNVVMRHESSFSQAVHIFKLATVNEASRIIDCEFINESSTRKAGFGTGVIETGMCLRTKFRGWSGGILTSNSTVRQFSFDSCEFVNCDYVINPSQVHSSTSLFISIQNCSILKGNQLFANATNASTLNQTNFKFNNNVVEVNSIHPSGSLLTVDTLSSWDNVFIGPVDKTNWVSYGDIDLPTSADAKFYNYADNDFRIELDSPLVLGTDYGDVAGAYGLASPHEFYDDIADADARAGLSFKRGSRTPNGLGTLAGGGETDPNKVLTTSTAIVGNYIPVNKSNVRAGVSVGLSEVGEMDIPSTTDVRKNVSFDNNTKTGSCAVPSPSDVRDGVDVDNTVGSLDVEAEANLPLEADVKTGSGNYGPDLDKVPSYSPDFPAVSNVAPDDTVDGQQGTMDLPALSSVDPLDTLRGQAGTMDVPSLSHVSPNDTLRGQTGTQDLPALNKVAPTDTLEGQAGTMDLPSLDSVLTTDTLEGQSGTVVLPSSSKVKDDTSYGPNSLIDGTLNVNTEANLPSENEVLEGVLFGENDEFEGSADVDSLANLPSETNVKTGSGNYGKDLDKVPSFTPDYPSVDSVLNTDTVDGQAGTVSLPATNKVVEGTNFGPNDSMEGEAVELDLNKFDDVPENKVEKDFEWKYNSDTNNRKGTAEVGDLSQDPGVWNVLKNVPYKINGEDKLGLYDDGEQIQTPGENIRVQLIKEIENTLYRINPETSPIYQSTIRLVSLESGLKQGILQSDLPFAQLVSDENSYNHKFVLSGNKAEVSMRIKLMITTPSNYTIVDNEVLYEDIRQAFIRDNFTLNGLAQSVKVVSVRPINSDSDKADDNRKAEISLDIVFIEVIRDIN